MEMAPSASALILFALLLAKNASAPAALHSPPHRAASVSYAERTFALATRPTDAADPPAASLWPLPRLMTIGSQAIALSPGFAFASLNKSSGVSSTLLEDAFTRYAAIIGRSADVANSAGPSLSVLSVSFASDSADLSLDTNESYALTIQSDGTAASLSCVTVFGCLHGLERFSQLVVVWPTPSNRCITGVPLQITDRPRFPHRGLMLDTSRHYLSMAAILRVIDGLAFDFENVLHLHLTDSQSFPFASVAVPELVRGAWSPTAAVYTVEALTAIQAYAYARGVAVVIELDTPAHVQSWGVGRPDILLNYSANPYLSILDPTTNATFDAVAALVKELAAIFPDRRFHAGVDEVNFGVLNVPHVNAWMAASGLAKGDYKSVVRYYMDRLQGILHDAGKIPLYWQEAFDHYGNGTVNPTPPPPNLSRDSIIYWWYSPGWGWANMGNVTAAGFRGVKTNDWYLDSVGQDWDAGIYTADPFTDGLCDYTHGFANCTCPTGGCKFNITSSAQQALILGGETAMWGERVDTENLLTRVWMRNSATAERLWSDQWVNVPALAETRLAAHRCRLSARGIASEPVMPSWCDGTRV